MLALHEVLTVIQSVETIYREPRYLVLVLVHTKPSEVSGSNPEIHSLADS